MDFQKKEDLKENKLMQPSTIESSTMQPSTIESSTIQSSTLLSSSKPSSLGNESQDYWYYCSHSYLTDDQNKSNYEQEKNTPKKWIR